MRLYRRSKEWDLKDTVSRCHLDAARGYVALAFERLADLEEELGEDAKIWYARGILHEECLGQGLKAYACFVKALALDPQYAFAAYNASVFAPHLAEALKWADVARPLLPEDRPTLDGVIADLNDRDDAYYGRVQLGNATLNQEDSRTGMAAAHIELALPLLDLEVLEEAALRRQRAQLLRDLDRAASQQYATRLEQFAPEDRLALAEAIAEIDRALALDEYAEKMWNHKSAWCNLMGRYVDSITAADKALELAPEGYHRPYINKAESLRRLHRTDEARECARKARQIAEQEGYNEDIAQCDRLLLAIDADSQNAELASEDAGHLLSEIVKAAQVTAGQEIGIRGGTAVATFREVLTHFPWGNPHATGTALDYVPLMVGALEFASPEYWWRVVHESAKEESKTYENCTLATLYIAAHADPIMQRDALHLLLLTICIPATPGGAEQIIESPPPKTFFRASALKNKAKLADELRCQMVREHYRRLILEVSAAATDQMAQLDHLMRRELARIQPELTAAIAEQSPVEETDKARARASILSQLRGTPFIVDPSTPRLGSRPGIPGELTLPTDLSERSLTASERERYDFKGSGVVMLASFAAVLLLKLIGVINLSWILVFPMGIAASVVIPAVIATIRNSRRGY